MPEVLGVIGAICVCVAYGLLQLNLNPKGLAYNLLNLLGSLLLGYSLIYNWNTGSMAIEVFWFLISVIGIKGAFSNIENSSVQSSYQSEFSYEPFDGNNYKLLSPFTFYYYTSDRTDKVYEHRKSVEGKDGVRRMITVPRSFITDFASIPKWLRFIFSPLGTWSKAATLHDFLYRSVDFTLSRGYTRKDCDLIFLVAMSVSKVPVLIRYLFYFAVRIFGKEHWDYYQQKDYTYSVGDMVILDPIVLGYESVERMVAFNQAKPERIEAINGLKITTTKSEYLAHALIPFKEH